MNAILVMTRWIPTLDGLKVGIEIPPLGASVQKIKKPDDNIFGESLRHFFLIMYGISLSNIFLRFFSGQKYNPLVYLNNQINGYYRCVAIRYSLIANILSIVALIVSIMVTFKLYLWLKDNQPHDYLDLIIRYVPIIILISLSPYCSFWVGTSVLTGLERRIPPTSDHVCFSQILEKEGIKTMPWWNSSYFFLYVQIALSFAILFYLTQNHTQNIKAHILCTLFRAIRNLGFQAKKCLYLLIVLILILVHSLSYIHLIKYCKPICGNCDIRYFCGNIVVIGFYIILFLCLFWCKHK
jgi:hypothetical protein